MADFATRQELADWLQTSVSNAQADLALSTASESIRDYCGWQITPVVSGAVYTVRRTAPWVLLPTTRLLAATGILDGLSVPVAFEPWGMVRGDGLVLGASDFLWAGTVITYEHGYAATPAPVKEACLALATRTITNPGDLVSESVAGYSATYGAPTGRASSFDDRIRLLLASYRTGVQT